MTESPETGSSLPAIYKSTIPDAGSSVCGRENALRYMSPSCFGLVMATGIVSLASWMMSYPRLAAGLFYLNLVQYLILWILYCTRAWLYTRHFFDDLLDHARGPGYFTMVAATGIVAGQFILLENSYRIGHALLVMAIVLWLLLTYAIFMAFTIKAEKPSLDQSIGGGWLLAVVATQSIAVCCALLAAHDGQAFREELNLLALAMWLWGGMLYTMIMTLIFYRYSFLPFSAGDMSPPYWINMGAMAISVLTGSLLVQNAAQAPFLLSILSFIKGFTLFYWAAGTWWIPMLLCLGLWRHIVRRFPFRYDPSYWGAIFPLGMYAASTWKMNEVMGFGFLGFLPKTFLYAAWLGWLLTFAAMMRRLVRDLVRA